MFPMVAGASPEQPGQKETVPVVLYVACTEAEKALDDKANDNLFHGLFTQRLRGSWESAERAAVRQICYDSYVDGESCGTNIHPITCSQDSADEYYYHTANSASGGATIEYR